MGKSQANHELQGNTVYSVIGNNIEAIKKREKMTSIEFYDLCFPGSKSEDRTKQNAITALVHGKEITLDKLISIATHTGTPIAALFSESENAYRENQQFTERDAGRVLACLVALFFNVAATNSPMEKGFIMSEEDLKKYYADLPPYIDFDGTGNAMVVPPDYERPLYLRITPWYYSHWSSRAAIPEQGERLFHFLTILTKMVSPKSPFTNEEQIEYVNDQLKKLSNDFLNIKPDHEVGNYDECNIHETCNWDRK